MISVAMATLGDEARLAAALASLVAAAADSLVKDVQLADDGASPGVRLVADEMGAELVGPGLREACEAARGEWLMILTQPYRLARGWEARAADLIAEGPGWAELSVPVEGWLQGVVRRRRGAEGLLVHRTLYAAAGGWVDGPREQALLLALRRRGGSGGGVRRRLAVLG
jgi:hypothetical protein